jgi:phospholipid/cholesterol/gamma-HCH transport system substrate-binding protein
MYSRVNYTVVGIFVLLFGIGLIWFAFWLGKYGLEEDYYTYKLEMEESISGLSIDSDVMLRGVDIGRVSEIRIDPENIERIEVYVLIRQDIPIKEDMVATTKMFGVTGLLSIEIEGGTNAAKTLQPTDDYIPTIKTKISFVGTLSQNIESLSQRLETLLKQSEKLLSDSNLEKVEKILDNVEKVTKKGERLEDETIQTLEEFRASMKKVTDSFEGATQDFAEVKKSLVPTIKNFNRVIVKLERDLNKGDYNLKKILEPLIVDMQIMTNQMTDLAREMEQSPSDVIFKSRKQLKGPGE